MADRAKKDPKVQETVEIVRRLDGLQEHAGWRYLQKMVVDRETVWLVRLARRLMAGEVVDQREIDYQRGFIRGALEVIERPEQAIADLELAARRAWTAAQLEPISQEATPYE